MGRGGVAFFYSEDKLKFVFFLKGGEHVVAKSAVRCGVCGVVCVFVCVRG